MASAPTKWRRLKRSFAKASNEGSAFSKAMHWVGKRVFALVGTIAAASGLLSLLKSDLSSRFAVLDIRSVGYAAGFLAVVWFVRAFSFIVDMARSYRESAIAGKFPAQYDLQATASLQRLRAICGSERYAAGSALELFSHPFIDFRLDDNGWNLEDVVIKETGRKLHVPPFADRNWVLDGDNNKKYTLVGFNQPYGDNANRLVIHVSETDWDTVQRTRVTLSANEELRHSLIDVDLTANEVPTSLCLHFLCLSSDHKFLALRRKPSASYYPNAFSISFEEQFDEVDLHYAEQHRAEAWFRRAICEEVFPLAGRYKISPERAWQIAQPHVRFMRIWQGFVEEDTANLSVFGVCQLALKCDEIVAAFEEIEKDKNTRRDYEGRLYIMDAMQIENLLISGHATAENLYHPDAAEEIVNNLHPTSLYRASQVFQCIRNASAEHRS